MDRDSCYMRASARTTGSWWCSGSEAEIHATANARIRVARRETRRRDKES